MVGETPRRRLGASKSDPGDVERVPGASCGVHRGSQSQAWACKMEARKGFGGFGALQEVASWV